MADSTPINILARIGQIELLHRVFGEVLIPPAVVAELSAPQTPDVVRAARTDFRISPKLLDDFRRTKSEG